MYLSLGVEWNSGMHQSSIWWHYWQTRKDQTPTRVERFLEQMDQAMPWSGLDRMLRLYFLQQWYGYSDQGVVEALVNMPCLQAFAGFDAGVETMPDRTRRYASFGPGCWKWGWQSA